MRDMEVLTSSFKECRRTENWVLGEIEQGSAMCDGHLGVGGEGGSSNTHTRENR